MTPRKENFRMYISNYFADSPIYDETISKFRNKAKENSRQAFSDFISENEEVKNEQSAQVTSGESENMIADNGVKSTLPKRARKPLALAYVVFVSFCLYNLFIS